MRASSNPLRDMKPGKVFDDPTRIRPDAALAQEVLPAFQKVVRARRAIRVFDGAPIPDEVMRDCLADALLAPSASNLQTYELYWLRDAARRDAMVPLCLDQPPAQSAGEMVVVVSRVDLWARNLAMLKNQITKDGTQPLEGPLAEYYDRIVPMLMRTDAFGVQNLIRRVAFWLRGLRGATVRGPVSRADHRIYGHIQSTLAAQTLMLSLAAHGYDSCPMTGIDSKGVRQVLGLPASAEVTMVIAAGRGMPEGLYGKRLRLPFDALVREV